MFAQNDANENTVEQFRHDMQELEKENSKLLVKNEMLEKQVKELQLNLSARIG